MKVTFTRKDPAKGSKSSKEFEVDKEFDIELPGIGKIKVKKLLPMIEINDEFIIKKKYSVRSGNRTIHGDKYEVLKQLLQRKASDVPVEVIDTLYYDTPSKATVSIDVFGNDKHVATISYYKEDDNVLSLVIKFMGSHFVKDIWIYRVRSTKGLKDNM